MVSIHCVRGWTRHRRRTPVPVERSRSRPSRLVRQQCGPIPCVVGVRTVLGRRYNADYYCCAICAIARNSSTNRRGEVRYISRRDAAAARRRDSASALFVATMSNNMSYRGTKRSHPDSLADLQRCDDKASAGTPWPGVRLACIGNPCPECKRDMYRYAHFICVGPRYWFKMEIQFWPSSLARARWRQRRPILGAVTGSLRRRCRQPSADNRDGVRSNFLRKSDACATLLANHINQGKM